MRLSFKLLKYLLLFFLFNCILPSHQLRYYAFFFEFLILCSLFTFTFNFTTNQVQWLFLFNFIELCLLRVPLWAFPMALRWFTLFSLLTLYHFDFVFFFCLLHYLFTAALSPTIIANFNWIKLLVNLPWL